MRRHLGPWALVVALGSFDTAPAPGQDRLEPVPGALPPAVRDSLERRRATVERLIDSTNQTLVFPFNARCGTIPKDDSATRNACQGEYNRLLPVVRSVKEQREQFSAAVHDAVEEACRAIDAPSTTAGGSATSGGGSAMEQLRAADQHGRRAVAARSPEEAKDESGKVFDTPANRTTGRVQTPLEVMCATRPRRVPPALARDPRFQALETTGRALADEHRKLEQELGRIRDRKKRGLGSRAALDVEEAAIKRKLLDNEYRQKLNERRKLDMIDRSPGLNKEKSP